MDQDKEYVTTVRFGVTTDTHDLTGRVLSETAVTGLTRERLEAACRGFVGRITQVPPMYSAVHHEGRRLYELAREGVEVERAPRDVVVTAIEVQAVGATSATLRIVCGKGTYVRVLAAELGSALGCGGAVERLVRTRVGPFALADAVAWSELEDAPAAALWARLLPLDAGLGHLPAARLDAAGARRFVHGQAADVATPVAAGAHVCVGNAARAPPGLRGGGTPR